MKYGFLNLRMAENQNAAQADAERRFFQPPLHLLVRRLFPTSTCELVAGKITDALTENFKVTQTFCGPEIPPCSPSARRSCKELLINQGRVPKSITASTVAVSI